MSKLAHNIDLYRDTLKDVLRQFAEIPERELDEFTQIFSVETFKKKTVIIPPGTTHNKFYFIVKGLVRIYYTLEGKEITINFREDLSFFTNGYTIFTGHRNFDCHEALEDTVCLAADYSMLEKLYSKYHALEHMGRKTVERYYTSFLKANHDKLFLSAEERYRVFMSERASIVNRVSLRYVASHLGITPETLSRLRARYQTTVKV